MTAADTRCQECGGKGTVAGQRCECVERRMREALEASRMVLSNVIFTSLNLVTDGQRLRWREITGGDDISARSLLRHINEILDD